MQNFTYFELITFFYRSLFDQIRQGISVKQSIGISLDSFWDYSTQPSDLQNIIILIESINVEFSLTKNYRNQPIKMYKELLGKISTMEISKFMNENEIEVFQESIEVLNNEIEVFLRNNQ